MAEEEPKVQAALQEDDDGVQVVDFNKIGKKKKKKKNMKAETSVKVEESSKYKKGK